MAGKEKLFAQFTLMNYLQGGRDRSVQEILDYLQQNTNWGRAQLRTGGPGDLGLRNVQNWLKEIRESPEFAPLVSYRDDPSRQGKFLYSSTAPTVGMRIMPVEEACLALMAEKFLQAAIPADFYDTGLQDLFRAARARLKELDKAPRQQRRRVREYLERIAIEQRGQTLIEQPVPYDVLGPISRAILEGKRIDCRYRGNTRELHPFGIVLRSPKIYLLAVDDHVIRRILKEDLVPAQFLCARIADVKVSERPNLVPDTFKADVFIKRIGLTVESRAENLPKAAFKLRLRIINGERDNLLDDLKAFPLAKQQRIEREAASENHILTAKGVRATHQLIEWIVGRLDRVEVLAPVSLRRHIVERLESTRALYT